jgi:hypothetical protein
VQETLAEGIHCIAVAGDAVLARAPGADAPAEAGGMVSFWPTCSLSGSVRLLAWMMAATLELFEEAIPDSVSPSFTV